jgi:hypothetical protein
MRLIVGGGGGGSEMYVTPNHGGAGGGVDGKGGMTRKTTGTSNTLASATGGGQGSEGVSDDGPKETPGNAAVTSKLYWGAGGGGAGTFVSYVVGSGAVSSSFVSGHESCEAVTVAGVIYRFTAAKIIDGDSAMPPRTGSGGRSIEDPSPGHIRITVLAGCTIGGRFTFIFRDCLIYLFTNISIDS